MVSLNLTRSVSLLAKSTSSSSFFVQKCQVLDELAYCFAESWADKVIEVQRISGRILLLKLVIGKAVLPSSWCTLQMKRPEDGKERLYDQLQYNVAKVTGCELPIPFCDWKDRIDAPAGVFWPRRAGFSTPNKEDESVLKIAIANGLCIRDTWFNKRDSNLIQLWWLLNLAKLNTLSRMSAVKSTTQDAWHSTTCWRATSILASSVWRNASYILTSHLHLEAQGPS